MKKNVFYVNVLLAHHIADDLTYKIISDQKPGVGTIVKAPLRSKDKIGIVTKILDNNPSNNLKIKNIIDISGDHKLNKKMIKFLNWVSDYNLIQRGLVLKMILSHRKFYFNKITDKKLGKDTLPIKNVTLSENQKKISNEIFQLLCKKIYIPILLDGVPGAGKTEIYFDVLKKILINGSQALIMFPEVSLTSDFVKRIEERFGEKPDVWHSKINETKKSKTLRRILSGEAKIIIGARSSLFLPFKNLSIIIVDEEHDTSYKQEENGIYHARDMSVVRASIENVPILLTSATPSLETIFNVISKKYNKVSIEDKFFNKQHNEVFIVNMKKEKLQKNHWVSNKLKQCIEEASSKNKQALLYINKRGYAPVVICKSCGYKISCTNCTSYLVEHLQKKKLLCHHCGHSIRVNNITCPSCKNHNQEFIDYGAGIEKIFTEVSKLFPLAKVCLFSSDHIKSNKDLEDKVRDIKNNKYDIIIGTQLISKGYHFPNLSCVGIIDADMTLKGGDLRASEKTYQALYQVAGRAGRENEKGTVVIQSYYPENETIQSLGDLNRNQFYENEINYRVSNFLPPSGRMAAIIVSGNNLEKVRHQCNYLYRAIPKISSLEIYGPAPAALSKLKGRHRQRFLVHDKKARNMQKIVNVWLSQSKTIPSVNISVDIDPYSFV